MRTHLEWIVYGPLRGHDGTDTTRHPKVQRNRISIAIIEQLLISQYNQDRVRKYLKTVYWNITIIMIRVMKLILLSLAISPSSPVNEHKDTDKVTLTILCQHQDSVDTQWNGCLRVKIRSLSIALILYRVAGFLELIPAGIGRMAGYTLDRSPVSHRTQWGNI